MLYTRQCYKKCSVRMLSEGHPSFFKDALQVVTIKSNTRNPTLEHEEYPSQAVQEPERIVALLETGRMS